MAKQKLLKWLFILMKTEVLFKVFPAVLKFYIYSLRTQSVKICYDSERAFVSAE